MASGYSTIRRLSMETTIRLTKKFKRNIRDYGPLITLYKMFRFLICFIYGSTVYRIYMIDLRKFAPRPNTSNEFKFKSIDESDTDFIRQIEAMEEWLQGTVTSKLAGGSLCLVALDKTNVAGFNLASFGEVYMPLVRTKRVFRKGEGWSEQITVHTDYRRKGLGSDLRYQMFAELKRRGYRKLYGGTLSNNYANLKLSRKVGLNEIADIKYKYFMGMKQWRVVKVRN